MPADALTTLDEQVVECRACPRLVAWREQVAREKRASFQNETYWGRPVPGFGPHDARILILGLAPAAHGGNRTGRMFTGDRSGDVLYASLHRVGLANQALAVSRDDGLRLAYTRITAPVKCAPPDNKPLPVERDNCSHWLHSELELLKPNLRVVVTLGAFAWAAWWSALQAVYGIAPKPRPKFAHGAEVTGSGPAVVASYHVSQQNTNRKSVV